MLKLNVRVIGRLLAGAAVLIAFGVAPQLALAQPPGSLSELASSPATGSGLSGTQDMVVSPDGANVYAIGSGDDAVAEFARGAGGSLTEIGCIADQSDSAQTSCSSNARATGLINPQAIAISPDGKNVYVAARDGNNGTIAEFARNADGSLTPISGSDCIAENVVITGEPSPCDSQTGHGIQAPDTLAVSPDGHDVYAGDENGQAVAHLTRGADGSLSEPGGADDCIRDSSVSGEVNDCTDTADGLSQVTGVVVSPDGNDVYTAGLSSGAQASIAEFTRNPGGSLSPFGCLGSPEDSESCTAANGVVGITGLVVSPDGRNVYSASEAVGGPIAEFSRGADGTLTQLASPNDCIQEQNQDFGCGSTGVGIGDGYELVVSPDGANVYAAAPTSPCSSGGACADVAEFARNGDGSLTQLASPDSCIQDSSVEGTECPGNENGTGLGGPGIAISPDDANVYVGGSNDVAQFARTPFTHTLGVTLAGSGSGAVSDGTGAIDCPSTCSHAYDEGAQVTLTATPGAGSTFTGWSGACSGTGTCQVTMSADMDVTATFTASPAPAPAPSAPGAPTPVLTGAPTAVTDFAAGFTGSVNPEGLPTSVYFQYGLDKRYSQLGASGPDYTGQTPAQAVGADFTPHDVGPVSVSGLVPNAIYHVRLVATNSAGTAFGQDVTFKTALAPLPGPPTPGQSFNVSPVSGLVFAVVHGHLVPLTQPEQIGQGTVLDSLHGTFQLVIAPGGGLARDAAARHKVKTQTGRFGGAVVRLHQATGGANIGLTTVMMVESAFKGAPGQAICHARGATPDASAAKLSSKTIQLLHASAHGKFSTSGRYSAATVRGTVWTIVARCDGTLVRDIKDEVVVKDFVRHKTILLHAGQSYLAPGPRKK